jgi:hypothetical protein
MNISVARVSAGESTAHFPIHLPNTGGQPWRASTTFAVQPEALWASVSTDQEMTLEGTTVSYYYNDPFAYFTVLNMSTATPSTFIGTMMRRQAEQRDKFPQLLYLPNLVYDETEMMFSVHLAPRSAFLTTSEFFLHTCNFDGYTSELRRVKTRVDRVGDKQVYGYINESYSSEIIKARRRAPPGEAFSVRLPDTAPFAELPASVTFIMEMLDERRVNPLQFQTNLQFLYDVPDKFPVSIQAVLPALEGLIERLSFLLNLNQPLLDVGPNPDVTASDFNASFAIRNRSMPGHEATFWLNFGPSAASSLGVPPIVYFNMSIPNQIIIPIPTDFVHPFADTLPLTILVNGGSAGSNSYIEGHGYTQGISMMRSLTEKPFINEPVMLHGARSPTFITLSFFNFKLDPVVMKKACELHCVFRLTALESDAARAQTELNLRRLVDVFGRTAAAAAADADTGERTRKRKLLD